MKKEAFEEDIETVLGRSWADLGSSWGAPWGQKRAVAPVALVFLKNRLLEKKKLQEATWARVGPKWSQLGPKRDPKCSPRGAQDEAKKEKKSEVEKSGVKKVKKRMRLSRG